MDIEKLIEQLSARGLRNGSSLGYHSGLFDEAATALSTLQAENEKLRAELDEKEKYYDQMIDALAATDSAELEQVKRERDAVKSPEVLEAVDELMEFARTRMSTGNCLYYVEVLGEWRGQKED